MADRKFFASDSALLVHKPTIILRPTNEISETVIHEHIRRTFFQIDILCPSPTTRLDYEEMGVIL